MVDVAHDGHVCLLFYVVYAVLRSHKNMDCEWKWDVFFSEALVDF